MGLRLSRPAIIWRLVADNRVSRATVYLRSAVTKGIDRHSGTCGHLIARHSGDFEWLILITNKA